MDDPQIRGTIEQLVAEEHELWARESAGSDRQRLRQRRALREAGRDPDAASLRRPEVLERYQQ